MARQKSPRGSGVYQRGSVWYTDYLDAPKPRPDGGMNRRRIREPLVGLNKRQAEDVVRERLGKVVEKVRAFREGRAESTLTVREYVETYFPWGEVEAGSSEYYNEMKVFEKYLFPTFGDSMLAAIRPDQILDFRRGLTRRRAKGKTTTLRPDTVNGIMAVLKRVLRRAASRGEIHITPGFPAALDAPALELEFTAAEEARLLAVFDNYPAFARSMSKRVVRHDREIDVVFPASRKKAYAAFRRARPLFVIALQTGLTREDLLNLKWKQVNLEAGHVTGWRRKTRQKYLTVFHDQELAREAFAECRSMKPVSAEYVLTNERGHRYTERSLSRYFTKALALAKIEPREQPDGTTRMPRFHDCRHTFATRWLEKGASLAAIGRMLGHGRKSWVQTTARYAKSSDEAVLAETGRINARRA